VSAVKATPVEQSRALSRSEADAFGRELDALRAEVVADLGQRDVDHMRAVVRTVHRLETAGRALLALGLDPVSFGLGTAALGVSKILENMEVGHNVMHGQYDWTRDPALDSHAYDWDLVCSAPNWRHSHNFMHHTYTNIIGKDRDIGYGILRMDSDQKWNPYYLGNPVYATLLMLFFQWGVMLHDLEVERLVSGEKKWSETKGLRRQMWHKGLKQSLKDYVLFPLLTGPMAPLTMAGNGTANLVRNVWAFAIIFCGHFPAGVESFTEEETENESRGAWYYRQMLGSANITGGKLFHLLTGNLSHQIEHHLFPDLPARRYAEIAPEVQDICARYGLPYNTGPLHRQIGSVAWKIVKLAWPFG
jgi:fatty acid desaturase